MKSKDCLISGNLDSDHLRLVHEFLLQLTGKGTLFINSQGGDEMAGFAIYDLLRTYVKGGYEIDCVGLGQVQSAAILPFLACDVRKTSEHCAFAIHHGTYDLSDPEPQREIPKIAEEIVRLDEAYMKVISNRTGLKLGKVRRLTADGFYFDPDTALRLGFATGRLR